MSEGTQLNVGTGGDTISDEDITGQPRLGGVVPSIPAASPAKLERTKIAVGAFGVDYGDATADNPLNTGDERLRRLAEQALVAGGPAGQNGERAREQDAGISTHLLLLEIIRTLKIGQLNVSQRPVQGQVRFAPVSANAGQTAYTALAANPLRQGAIFVNDSNTASAANVYLLFTDGSPSYTVTKDNYTVALTPGGYFETPFGYTGRIDCIWDGTAGQLNITEVM